MPVNFQFREVFLFSGVCNLLLPLVSVCDTAGSLELLSDAQLLFSVAFMWASQVAWWVNDLHAMQEMQVQSLGWEHPLQEGVATLSSIRAWRVPWTEDTGGLWSMGPQRLRHDWSDWASNPWASRVQWVSLVLRVGQERNQPLKERSTPQKLEHWICMYHFSFSLKAKATEMSWPLSATLRVLGNSSKPLSSLFPEASRHLEHAGPCQGWIKCETETSPLGSNPKIWNTGCTFQLFPFPSRSWELGFSPALSTLSQGKWQRWVNVCWSKPLPLSSVIWKLVLPPGRA